MPLRSLSWAPVVPDRFRYNSLPSKRSIRLLSVTPPEHSHGQLRCRLHSFNLADCPPFDALSYSWRDPILSESEIVTGKPDVETPDTFHEIVVDGRSTMVTENLFSALSALSRDALCEEGGDEGGRGRSRYVWADALCIDQTNNAEKADQIGLMGDIYAGARTVVIWLGPVTPELSDVVWLHADFADRLDAFVDAHGFAALTACSPLDPDFLRALGYAEDDVPLLEWYRRWGAYFRFFRQRRWFGRAWVVQEAVLARSVVVRCGGSGRGGQADDDDDDDGNGTGVELPWDRLWALARVVGYCRWAEVLAPASMAGNKTAGMGSLDIIANFQLCYRAGGPSAALWRANWARVWRAATREQFWWCFLMWAMDLVCDQSCAVPVDQIYAVLGVANAFWPAEEPRVVVPDYESAPHEVFVGIAKLFLSRIPCLALLSSVEDRSERSLPNLPSWVPDWSATKTSMLRLGSSVIENQPAYDASREDSWEYPLCQFDDRTLVLRGAKFDTVVEVSEDLGTVATSHFILPCLEMCASLGKYYPATGEHRVEALWRTMVANQLDEHQIPAPPSAAETFKDWAWMMLPLGLYIRQDSGQPCDEYIRRMSCLNDLAGDDDAPVLLPFRKQVLWRAEFFKNKIDSLFGEGQSKADMEFIQEGQGRSLLYASALSFNAGARRLYRTSQGCLGLGPKSMKKGDEVWLIQGARVPFIMRTAPKDVEMVGETYLHGFMHGQMLKRLKDGMQEIRIV